VDLIERKIQEARERGDFDNLPGAGKPLNLDENPFVPAEWRLAYSMLASNGFAPDLVESDKALREAIVTLAASLDRFAARWSRLSASDRQARLVDRAAFLRQYEADVRDLNSRIHGFNHAAPTAMQRGTLLVDQTLASAAARLPIAG
jgi:DnaJ family protein C protein 28